MNIATLANRQKRLKDWSVFSETEVSNPAIKRHLQGKLKEYSGALMRCFELGLVSEQDEFVMRSLERELEMLSEEARLSVVPKHP